MSFCDAGKPRTKYNGGFESGAGVEHWDPGNTRIIIRPSSSLIDDPVSIKIDGIRPNSKISVRSTLTERANLFESVGHFIADENGNVDLDKHHSVGGNYTGVEPMGLFWSLKPAPNVKKGTQFLRKDVTKPVEFTFTVFNDHLKLDSITTSQPLACTTIERWFMRSEHVDRSKVHHGRIRGTLFKPKGPGPGPFPGVIDLYGSAGGIVEFRSALLASHGFATLCLPYFAYEDLPRSLDGLELEYFEESVDWLSVQHFVAPGGIGVVGASLGGCIALQMAASLQKIKAVVAISAVNFLPQSFLYKGKELGNPGKKDLVPSYAYMSDIGVVTREALLLISKEIDRVIEVEHFEGDFLFVVGEDDQNWPANVATNMLIQKLHSHNKKNYKLLTYPGAGHLIEPPYKPTERAIYNAPFGVIFDFGGEAKAHAYACQDSWFKMLTFLRTYISSSSRAKQDSVSKL